MSKVASYLKAIVAFITPGVIALGACLTEQSPGGTGLTSGEIVTIAVAMLATGGAVCATPNKPKAA